MNTSYCQHSGCNLLCSFSSSEFCQQHLDNNQNIPPLGNLQMLKSTNSVQQPNNSMNSAHKIPMYLPSSGEEETVNDVNDLLEMVDVGVEDENENDDGGDEEEDDEEEEEEDDETLGGSFKSNRPQKRQEKAKWSEDEVKYIFVHTYISYQLSYI